MRKKSQTLELERTTYIACLSLGEAFHCVDHYILLFKLKFYGIKGKGYALYES
jgi:hypothetical protein